MDTIKKNELLLVLKILKYKVCMFYTVWFKDTAIGMNCKKASDTVIHVVYIFCGVN